uniref:Uncharacterized protein n=1 Tax=Trichogramma kaykai TaxID=54128 RepID=A0ABD2VS86_9HYME
MEYIIDVQSFKSHGNKFIFKEVALISLAEKVPSVYLFKPPHAFMRHSPTNKASVRWLENNYHRLKWSCGDIDYSELDITLLRALHDAQNVYVKGADKVQWLRKYSSEIIDLETVGCPALYKLQRLPACAHHSLIIDAECAVSNVLALKEWLNNVLPTKRTPIERNGDIPDSWCIHNR